MGKIPMRSMLVRRVHQMARRAAFWNRMEAIFGPITLYSAFVVIAAGAASYFNEPVRVYFWALAMLLAFFVVFLTFAIACKTSAKFKAKEAAERHDALATSEEES